MHNQPDLSFELLHLITVISNRITLVFKKCNLTSAQMYTLVYLNSHGNIYRQDQKIILRDRFTNILKQTFKLNKDQVSDLLKEIYDNDFIDDFYITKVELQEITGSSRGRTRVLGITKRGVKKVGEFGAELVRLHRELTQKNSKLLCPPDAKSPGVLGAGITAFLAVQEVSAVPKVDV